MTYPSNWVETVAYNPSLLYSTLIVAILLTKGYGRHMAMAIGRKLLHEPSRKVWRAVRAIKPRQIVYYGLRWGIPLHQLKELLLLHRNIVKKRPFKGAQRCSQKDKKDKKLSFRRKSLNSTVSMITDFLAHLWSWSCGFICHMTTYYKFVNWALVLRSDAMKGDGYLWLAGKLHYIYLQVIIWR